MFFEFNLFLIFNWFNFNLLLSLVNVWVLLYFQRIYHLSLLYDFTLYTGDETHMHLDLSAITCKPTFLLMFDRFSVPFFVIFWFHPVRIMEWTRQWCAQFSFSPLFSEPSVIRDFKFIYHSATIPNTQVTMLQMCTMVAVPSDKMGVSKRLRMFWRTGLSIQSAVMIWEVNFLLDHAEVVTDLTF